MENVCALMNLWRFSLETMTTIMEVLENDNLSTQDLDFIRMVILFKGMDYAKENLFGKDFKYEQIIEDIDHGSHGMADGADQEKKSAEVEHLMVIIKDMEQECEHNRDMIARLTEENQTYLDLVQKQKQQLEDQEKKLENQLADLQEKDNLTKENENLLAKLREVESAVQEEIYEGQEFVEEPRTLFSRFLRPGKKYNDRLVVQAIKAGLSKDKVQLLTFALQNHITEKEFQEMSQPDLSYEQMEMLCKVYFKRHGINKDIPMTEERGDKDE